MLHTLFWVMSLALVLVMLPAILVALVGGMAHAAVVAPRSFPALLLAATVAGSLAHFSHGFPLELALACGLTLLGQLGIEFLREYRGI
jgi:hypothetical protein